MINPLTLFSWNGNQDFCNRLISVCRMSDKIFSFWQKWLLVVGIYLILFGLALAFFNQSFLFDLLLNNQINPIFWLSQPPLESTQRFQAFVYGILGTTIAGWGVCLSFIIHYPFKQRKAWAWKCIVLAIALWFVTDTAISLFFGVTYNALFNISFLLNFAIPLFATRKVFLRQS